MTWVLVNRGFAVREPIMPTPLDQLVRDAAGQPGAIKVRAGARLMSALEDNPERLPELFRAANGLSIAPSAVGDRPSAIPSPRLVLGITGAPGSGKSTLTDSLVARYRALYPDRSLGVIAVDPSSPFTGGAVLGDRVRMMRHATDERVFIRSLASRGHLGGLSLGVRGVLRVMGLLGCDTVFIETVGVGQSEVEVTNVADLVLIVLAPGQGDSVQLLKAGLMEIGDVFVVNKADKEGAHTLYAQILSAMKLAAPDDSCGPHHGVNIDRSGSGSGGDSGGGGKPGASDPDSASAPACDAAQHEIDDALFATRGSARGQAPVYLVSSVEQQGLDKLVEGLEGIADQRRAAWRRRREESVVGEIRDAVLEEARRRLVDTLGSNGTLGAKADRVLSGEVTVSELVQELLNKSAGGKQGPAW